MEYKYIDISDYVSIPVPKGLTADEEATFIAGRLAFVNLEALELEGREALRLLKEGKLTRFEDLLDELECESSKENGKPS